MWGYKSKVKSSLSPFTPPGKGLSLETAQALTRKLNRWEMDDLSMHRFGELNINRNATYETFRKGLEHPNPEISANVLLSLTEITIYLLRKQINSLEKAFLNEGAFREKMTRARMERRNRNKD